MALRAVLFGLEGILIKDRKGDQTTGLVSERRDQIYAELVRLFEFLRSKDIRPIVVSNRDWRCRDESSDQLRTLDDALRGLYGDHTLYVAQRGDMRPKPTRACIETVLAKEELQTTEVVYVGMSEHDFRTAHNGGLLFLNAVWDRQEVGYGFVFQSPQEILRFIDLFALKEHPWFYRIDEPVRYRSPAPFSTRLDDFKIYSDAARRAAKAGSPERHFFLNTLVASLYFTGAVSQIDYIACVPRHLAGFGNAHMDDVLEITGGIFGKRYLRDLVVRHTDAPSEREERIAGRPPKPDVQLSTIRLTKYPLKDATQRYKTPIKLEGKTVLLFDDFTTNGYTMEAVRLHLARAGADAFMVSWLKTINSDYCVLTTTDKFDPYSVTSFKPADVTMRHLPYRSYIVDRAAPEELDSALRRFREYGRCRKGRV